MNRNKPKQSLDKSKAAKLFIDNYYQNLLKNQQERLNRRKQNDEEIKNLPKKVREKKEKENMQRETEYTRSLRSKITKKDFQNIKLVGRGAFGEVRLVRKLDNNEYYAMKIINKDFMIEKNHLAHARAERDAMVNHDYPGIVKLYYSFQDDLFLYFVMEFLQGGDLMNLLIEKDTLSESHCRFYMMELILAVQAAHSMNFIHRDLKPDNILIDKEGHIKLSDFGLCTSSHESHLSSFYHTSLPEDYEKKAKVARENSKGRGTLSRRLSWQRYRKAMSYSTVGTSNYMAPEILLEKGYGKEVDWWSVGVILYECLFGYAPFSCEDTTETCLMILDFKNSLEIPPDVLVTPEALDLVHGLICESSKRLKYEDIISHPWFNGADWDNVRESEAPWIPDIESPTDTKYFDELDDDSDLDWEADNTIENNLLKNLDEKHLPFVGWTFKRFEKEDRPRKMSIRDIFSEVDTKLSDSDSPIKTKSEKPESVKKKKPKSTKIKKQN